LGGVETEFLGKNSVSGAGKKTGRAITIPSLFVSAKHGRRFGAAAVFSPLNESEGQLETEFSRKTRFLCAHNN
jgi:hypothetical protein